MPSGVGGALRPGLEQEQQINIHSASFQGGHPLRWDLG